MARRFGRSSRLGAAQSSDIDGSTVVTQATLSQVREGHHGGGETEGDDGGAELSRHGATAGGARDSGEADMSRALAGEAVATTYNPREIILLIRGEVVSK